MSRTKPRYDNPIARFAAKAFELEAVRTDPAVADAHQQRIEVFQLQEGIARETFARIDHEKGIGWPMQSDRGGPVHQSSGSRTA